MKKDWLKLGCISIAFSLAVAPCLAETAIGALSKQASSSETGRLPTGQAAGLNATAVFHETPEATARTVVAALVDGNEKLLKRLYSPNYEFFVPYLKSYFACFEAIKLEALAFEVRGEVVSVTEKDRNIIGSGTCRHRSFNIELVKRGGDYYWKKVGWK